MIGNSRWQAAAVATLLFSVSFVAVSKEVAIAAPSSTLNTEVPNTLTEQEKQQGWQLLFDGKTTEGWHPFQHRQAPSAWEVKDGVLTVNLKASGVQHGDLATNQEFENYELQFDWKSPADGNSGVFINVQEAPEHQIAWQTGPEYQLLGTAHKDNEDPAKRSGDIFGYTSPLARAKVHDNDQWNHSVIKQHNGKVEFYLNGSLTSSVDFTSTEWKDWLAQSRFKDLPHFSAMAKGHIVLQEWTSPIFFRNMKIRQL